MALLYRTALILACLMLGPPNASAQSWPPWADESFSRGPSGRFERPAPWDEDTRPPQRLAPALQEGGARPDIAPKAPPLVAFPYDYPANSIVIDTGGRKLYYVQAGGQAYAYPISVGREGFNWSGTEAVSRKQAWPDWHPPAEMRERDPQLPEKMTGGVRNPLGAMALYLGTTLYRIHGTNDVKSIGRAQSSGCFRMLNSAVLHLASLVEIGTQVAVVPSLQGRLEVSRAPAEAVPPTLAKLPPSPPATNPRDVPRATSPDYRSLREHALGRPSQVIPQ